MAASVYGIGASELIAHPDFTATRDEEGGWSATQTFTCIEGAWENSLAALFVKGTPITILFPQLAAGWAFLQLESFEVRKGKGGLNHIAANFRGYDADFSFDPQGEELTYTLSGSRVSRSIMEHPLLIREMANNSPGMERLHRMHKGQLKLDQGAPITTAQITVRSVTDRAEVQLVTDEFEVKWGKVILLQGILTFQAPTIQWTIETANSDGLEAADIEYLGRVEFTDGNKPPGDPPMPFEGFFEWLKISCNSSRTKGVRGARTSQTWELSPPGGFHRFEAQTNDGLETRRLDTGIYKYELADVL
jgi:hypothetical protein